MPVEVIMPKVDMDMTSGRIVIWHAAAGDRVEKGAALFDIETDKAAMEVEAPANGVLRHPVDEGTDVPIGQPVAWLYADGETADEPPRPGPEPSPAPTSHAEEVTTDELSLEETPSLPRSADGKVRATPLARSLARDGGIGLDDIDGSGARGRVQADDVRARLDARTGPSAPIAIPAETGALAFTRSGGETGTPVLLLHGFASDSVSWGPLERQLKGHPILRMDLPSHGKSPNLDIAGFADLAATVRKAFDGLGLDKAHLIGHSLGGALALALADTRERSVESLTLIAPAGLGPEINGKALDGICRATRPESLGPWLKTLVADQTLITDGYVRAAMATRRNEALRAAQRRLADVLFPDGVQAFDLRAALGRISVPTRLIWGRRDDIIPWRHALGAPGSVALHLFEGLGHLPQVEASADLGEIIRSHLSCGFS